MKNGLIFTAGFATAVVLIPVAFLSWCIYITMADPDNPYTIVNGEVVLKEEFIKEAGI